MKNLVKKMVAEAIGTFVLVFIACGVAGLTGGSVDGGTIASTALAFGLVIVAMAYSIGRISGCHINPAVSFACAITKRMKWSEFVLYVVSQLVGAILGGIAVFGIIKMAGCEPIGNACNYAVGYVYGEDLTAGKIFGALLTEIVLTAIFVYVILNVTDAKNEGIGKKAGIVIGLTLTLVHLVGIRLTGTSVNPARSIGTAFAALVYNNDTQPFMQVWMFIVGPLAGGALAALMFNLLNKSKEA